MMCLLSQNRNSSKGLLELTTKRAYNIIVTGNFSVASINSKLAVVKE